MKRPSLRNISRLDSLLSQLSQHTSDTGAGMRVVKVNKNDLLKKLEENLKNHRATFEKAIERFREVYTEKLEKMLEDAQKNRRYDQYVNLIAPMDQSKEYRRAIEMLKMSVDETIELTQQEFAQYVQDDWAWKGQWENSTMSYATGAMPDPRFEG